MSTEEEKRVAYHRDVGAFAPSSPTDKQRDETPRTKALQEECQSNPAGRYRKAQAHPHLDD